METLPPPTPEKTVRNIIDQLRTTSLEPSDTVNALFRQLVNLSLTSLHLKESTLREARSLASEGESKLEHHWAERIINNPRELDNFPYLDNYLELAQHEYEALKAQDKVTAEGNWAFIGSGPLPLSAIFLERLHGSASFTYIDASEEANRLGKAVATTLGGHKERRFITQDVRELSYEEYDVIIMAALVGQTEAEKHDALNHIAVSCKPDALVAARSVPNDGRTLLYPRLQQVPAVYELIAETVPPTGIINSLVMLEKR